MIMETSNICFEHDVLKVDGYVLVDFWAEWCAPCKLMAPILEEIAKSHAGVLCLVKLDVGLHPSTAARYRVRGLPVLMLFKAGVVIAQRAGSANKKQLLKFLSEHLNIEDSKGLA